MSTEFETTLSYPNYPHTVEIDGEIVEQWVEDEENSWPAFWWLVNRKGGPLLVTTVSMDADRPFERPIAVFSDTSQFIPSCLWHLRATEHVIIDGGGTLYHGAVRFNFHNPETAMLFKLTFGGAQ